MKIYLATWLRDYNNGPCMTKVGADRRLLSYFLYQEEVVMSDYPESALPEYVQTGCFESRKTLR